MQPQSIYHTPTPFPRLSSSCGSCEMNSFALLVCLGSTLPSTDSPYPILVLTGPQGCGKRELTHQLCQEFGDYFAYGSVSSP